MLSKWWGRFFGSGDLGRRGEKAALRYLRQHGYALLARNYKVSGGEVDLVMQDEESLVFVEVKTRRQEDYIDSEFLINQAKQHRIELAARHFAAKYRGQARPQRFDVVVVLWPEGSEPEFRHYRHAFRTKH